MLRIFPDQEALSIAAAQELLTLARSSVRERGQFFIAVSGGATPARLYELLSQSPWREPMPWAQTELFWVDERCVPPDSPESNYRLVHDRLLSKLSHDGGDPHLHRMMGEAADPDAAARAYEDDIRRTLATKSTPNTQERDLRLDIVLLGMGTDGHTASLFPGTPALEENVRWVVVGHAPTPPQSRITMTLPLLNHARRAMFLVSGETKAKPLVASLAAHSQRSPDGPPAAQSIPPAGRIALVDGATDWFVDRAAAACLSDDDISAFQGAVSQ